METFQKFLKIFKNLENFGFSDFLGIKSEISHFLTENLRNQKCPFLVILEHFEVFLSV